MDQPNTVKAIQLPETIEQVRVVHFPKLKVSEILKLLATNEIPYLTDVQTLVAKYSACAFLHGRPMGSVLIFLAGYSGAGKSSTINSLFADDSLCKTSSTSSETKSVSLVRKLVTATVETPHVAGYLGFVDVPGTFDTDSKNETTNLALIRKFKNTRIELAERKGLHLRALKLRKSVYPNVVLFVASAADKRIAGKDSVFAKSVKALQKTGDIIDVDKPNVIVALTHAMSLPRNKAKFIQRLDEITKAIQDHFRALFDINVEVVPVENQPEDYELEKVGDFYKLPNGQLSHYNLFEAMMRVFDNTGDVLARLLVSTYFGSSCPARADKPEILDFDGKSSELEIQQLSQDIQEILPGFVSQVDKIIPQLNFQSLTFGYCPVTEQVKTSSPIKVPTKLKTVEIGESKFAVPDFVDVFVNRESKFQKLSFMQKSEYQEHMQRNYGLEAGLKLVVSVGAAGKWISDTFFGYGSSLLSMAYETQVATLKIKDVALKRKPEFDQELARLPNVYEPSTAQQFQAFFSRWGSHLIVEQAIGGSAQLNCTVENSAISGQKLAAVERKAEGMFRMIFAGASDNISGERASLREMGVCNEHLRIKGGVPPAILDWATVSPAELLKWGGTINDNPAELQTSLKLYPYYNFLEYGTKYQALRAATSDHLSNKLSLEIQRHEMMRAEIARINAEKAKYQAPIPTDGGGGCGGGGGCNVV